MQTSLRSLIQKIYENVFVPVNFCLHNSNTFHHDKKEKKQNPSSHNYTTASPTPTRYLSQKIKSHTMVEEKVSGVNQLPVETYKLTQVPLDLRCAVEVNSVSVSCFLRNDARILAITLHGTPQSFSLYTQWYGLKSRAGISLGKPGRWAVDRFQKDCSIH
jgi:hypothetical protein